MFGIHSVANGYQAGDANLLPVQEREREREIELVILYTSWPLPCLMVELLYGSECRSREVLCERASVDERVAFPQKHGARAGVSSNLPHRHCRRACEGVRE